MNDVPDRRRFEQLALPHLDAAYNLARWLTRNDQDAEDVVQEAVLRALRYFARFRGDSARAWLLQIVRNTCYTWLQQNRPAECVAMNDDEGLLDIAAPSDAEPQAIALRNADRMHVNEALSALPIVYREVLILRELEDLSYKEIAAVADVPIGTVMSRLARARALMREALTAEPTRIPHAEAGAEASTGHRTEARAEAGAGAHPTLPHAAAPSARIGAQP